MRSLLVVLLVGCGGGSKQAPPPVAHQPETKPMVVENTRPTCAFSPECTVATMEYFSVQMCACKDKECATSTNREMTMWGVELGKSAAGKPGAKPDPALAQRATDVMATYTKCIMELVMPPPDPCAGGADPCGG